MIDDLLVTNTQMPMVVFFFFLEEEGNLTQQTNGFPRTFPHNSLSLFRVRLRAGSTSNRQRGLLIGHLPSCEATLLQLCIRHTKENRLF